MRERPPVERSRKENFMSAGLALIISLAAALAYNQHVENEATRASIVKFPDSGTIFDSLKFPVGK